MSDRIAIYDLKPGMVIEQITRQNGPVKIRKSGLVTSAAMVQGLAEMGVQEVQVDPEQTVEIAADVRPKTQTQALLRGHHDTSASFDHNLSDQFNRSLFLPTVQGLPSVWKVYARQYLVVAIIVAGGFSIGFTAATPGNWWPGLVSLMKPSASQPVQVATVPAPQTQSPAAVANPDQQRRLNTEAANSGKAAGEPGNSTQAEVAQLNADQTSGLLPNGADQNAPQTNPQRNQAVSGAAARESSASDAETEGEIINEPPQDNVSVSPELMARFNQVVADMEKADSDPDPVQNTQVNVHSDVPRVDQLPARLLTRLPSMSFSAHMYASRRGDRWVRVNGNQLGEGDWIADQVQIINIEAQRVILKFQGETFSMAALTDW